RAGFCLPWHRVHGFTGDFALPAHFHLCRRSAGMGRRRPANRLGSDLVSLWRGQRHRAGLVALLEELSGAPSPTGLSLPEHYHAAWPDGLRDPAFAGGDQHGRPDGRGTLELLVGRGPVRSPAPHGHGFAHLRVDLPAGRISHALAALAADGPGGPG